MEREIISTVDYLNIVSVKSGERIKRYEISPIDAEGFYRISEEKIETGKVCFPGAMELESILNDISKVEKE